MFAPGHEPVSFQRDCSAVVIPAGEAVELPAGTIGYLTQSLGGSFTVYVEGNLFRIAGEDADAIGKEPAEPPSLPDGASDEDVEALIWSQLKECYDPEIPVNVVDLGLIYRCEIEKKSDGRYVSIDMTLTAPGCGMGEILVDDVAFKVGQVPTVESVDVALVFDPPWRQDMMSEEALLETGLM
jgi:probable FeS assembly SUF system protein SufT